MARISAGAVGWGLALLFGVILIGKCAGDPSAPATSAEPSETARANAPILRRLYVTAANGLNCRAEPSTSSNIATRLPVNARVGVVEERGSWSHIGETSDCWVSSAYLSESPITIDPPRVRSLSAYSEDRGPARPARSASSAYYANCSAARAAGAAPVYASEPGYSRRLDRDGDGVGCE